MRIRVYNDNYDNPAHFLEHTQKKDTRKNSHE